ncbi:hypothetical protein O0I10_003100 [Lichtheimia ornata]|uniref:PIH1 N-terminal domain-containing protein n=1 Tax=Lichtheimia ornata TaxID=688661 RepID=A0AAD7V9Z9_9FUNG|nr:uncharacterized protein O0I10_003100 [Lichtheimia ornata]KAJ8661348.1 hypothetical protein O0I10_003100 [Lichtheimia ornata]
MPTLEPLPDDAKSSPFILNNNTDANRDFDSLTKEEQDALLDHVAAEFAQDPKAMERLAAKFLQEAKRGDFRDVNVQPQPGYVCKTKVVKCSNKKYASGTVVYINICYADAIPAPPVMPESEIEKAFNADPTATYRVPVSLGQERNEHDNAGKPALIFDACINTQPYMRSERHLEFRLYILELCIELIEERISVELSREFTMPKTPSKGEIPARVLRLPKPALVSAVRNQKKPKKEEKSKPIISVDEARSMLKVVIPQMPALSSSSWSLDIEPTQLLLGGVGSSLVKIALPRPVKVDDTTNTATFYKKSLDLVIELALAPRKQYL